MCYILPGPLGCGKETEWVQFVWELCMLDSHEIFTFYRRDDELPAILQWKVTSLIAFPDLWGFCELFEAIIVLNE